MIYSRVVFPKLTVSLTNHHPPKKIMKESYPLSPFSPCLPSAPALECFWKWSLKPKEWLRVMLEAVEQAGDGDGVGGVSCHTQMQPLKGQAWGAAQSAIWSIVGPVWSIGEELVDFWILVEKILSIDEMDLEVRDHYLSLLFVLKATHLQESSWVLTLCNMNISKNHKVYLRWNPWEKKKINPMSDTPQSLALQTTPLSIRDASGNPNP